MNQQYSHRNGEIEPPTEAGLYWMRENNEGGTIVELKWQDEIPDEDGIAGYPAGFEVWVIGSEREYFINELDAVAQWWGPIVPPWGAA